MHAERCWEAVLQSLGCCCILCLDTLPGWLVGSGCASSEGSSALDHSVFIMKAKHNLVCVCVYMCVCVCVCVSVRAYVLQPSHPSPFFFSLTPLWPASNYCLPMCSSSLPLQPFLSLLFHLTFLHFPWPRSSLFFHSPSLPLSPLVSLPFSFLSVVRRLCRNVSSSSPLINSLLSQSLLPFSFFFVALITLLFLSYFL